MKTSKLININCSNDKLVCPNYSASTHFTMSNILLYCLICTYLVRLLHRDVCTAPPNFYEIIYLKLFFFSSIPVNIACCVRSAKDRCTKFCANIKFTLYFYF